MMTKGPGGGGFKNLKKLMTSFMNGPKEQSVMIEIRWLKWESVILCIHKTYVMFFECFRYLHTFLCWLVRKLYLTTALCSDKQLFCQDLIQTNVF